MRPPLAAALAAALLGALAAPALARERAETDPAAAPIPSATSPGPPPGEFCTPLGCVGARAPHWTGAVAFGAAALAAGWLGRRGAARRGRPRCFRS